MITIDARRCGAGKTRGENNNPHDTRSINFKVNALVEENEKVLVVLPGIHLIKEYQQQFPYAKAIYSDISGNVANELFNSISEGDRLILITHKAFLQQVIHSGTKQHYNLIIDEAFDPWSEQTISSQRKDIIFDWEEHTIINEAFIDFDYYEIEFTDLATNNITYESNIVRDLMNKNWLNYVKRKQYDELIQTGKKRISIIQELSPYIFSGWRSIHIAAAAFEWTFLGWWMEKHEIGFEVVYPFIPHDTPIFVYYPSDSSYKEIHNSKHKKFHSPWIRDQFNEYVSSVTEPVLRLKNNIDKNGAFSKEHCVKHNVAGVNEYSHIANISLESSLNPSPELACWFRLQQVGGTIYGARTGYLYYQVLMRSCLRNGEEATIYTLDSRAAICLCNYFEHIELQEFILVPPVDLKVLKKDKPLTSTERSQVKRFRDKNSLHKNKSPREVLSLIHKRATQKL